MQPKLVTFDAYTALLDIEGSLVPRVAGTFGLPEGGARAVVQLWRAKQMELAACSNSLAGPRMSFRDATRLGLNYAMARHRLTLDAAGQEALVFAWDELAPWPEANHVLREVSARGFATAILSNGDSDMLAAIAARFDAGFDHVLSSQAAGKYKPHPAVYALPTAELGIAAADVLHVAGGAGDVLGAVAAGMACIWSNRFGEPLLNPAFQPLAQTGNLQGILPLLA